MMNQKRKAGRKKFQETRHPTYKGVRQRNGKWVCEIRQPNNNKSRLWLGTFASPDMAAMAHDVAALAFKGDSASLNFPHSASSLPRLNHRTSSLRSIQFAAMEAAEKLLVHGGVAKSISPVELSDDVEGCEIELEEKLGEEEKVAIGRSTSEYWDEEEVFNMPLLMDSMAEALMVTPPSLHRGFSWDEMETPSDLNLWVD